MIDTVDEQIFRRTQWSDDIVSRGFAVKNVIKIIIVTMIISCDNNLIVIACNLSSSLV